MEKNITEQFATSDRHCLTLCQKWVSQMSSKGDAIITYQTPLVR